MTKMILLSLFGALILTSAAKAELRSAKALQITTTDNHFTATLLDGYHFNDKAPNVIKLDGATSKPLSLEARKAVFSIANKTWGAGTASLYVCDDAQTYCETHHVTVSPRVAFGGGGAPAEPVTNDASAKPTANKSKKVKWNRFGFIEGDLEAAAQMAKAKKQLVMIEFGAKWCPGCVRYEKEIFPTKEFKAATKNIVKLSVDVDQPENFATADRFGIKGIPSMVFINGDQEEVERLVDFHLMEKLKVFLASLQPDMRPTKELLSKKDFKDDEERLAVGRRLWASEHFAEATEVLAPLKPMPMEYLSAKTQMAKKEFEKIGEKNSEPTSSQKESYARVLREALKQEPSSTRSLAWRGELIKALPKDSAEKKQIVEESQKLVELLLKDEEQLKLALATEVPGEFLGYEKLMLMFLLADVLDSADASKEEMAALWKRAEVIGRDYHIPPEKAGPSMRYLIVLTLAENYPAAEVQANAILKKDPNNLDVQRRKIKILLALKKYEPAKKIGESILHKVEGRNQFWVGELLAKAYVGLELKQKAQALLEGYLARPEINEKSLKSSKKGMEDLLKTLTN